MTEKEYGYIEGGTLVSRFLTEQREVRTDEEGKSQLHIITVEEQAAALSDEWKPVDRIDADLLDTHEAYQIVIPVPYDAGDHIAYAYQKKFDVRKVRADIAVLKDALSASDYKVSKCYEASILGEPLPYDVESLHSERQAQRDEINNLEALLTNYPQNMITL